jgi:hypothetical protein
MSDFPFSIATTQETGKYYLGLELTTNQDMTDNDTQQLVELETYLPSPYNNVNSDFNNSTHKWTCPKTGLYLCSLRITISMGSDDIRASDIYIVSNDGSDDYKESGSRYANSTHDDVQVMTLYCESLIPMTAGHTLRGEGRIVRSTGSGREFLKNAVGGGRATEMIITRVS